MLILPLCKKFCPDKIPLNIQDRLGEGANGEVFTISNLPDQVIKLSIVYEVPPLDLQDEFLQIKRGLEYLKSESVAGYTKVFNYTYLGSYSREVEPWRSQQSFILYYYIMEKLEKLTSDEEKVFHSIISHEDRGIEKKFSLKKIEKMLQEMNRALDFDVEKIIIFCKNITIAPLHHLDIHARNIMKDKSGNFKLIDLDSVQLEKKNGKE